MIFVKKGIKVFSFSISTNSVNLNKNYYKILEVDYSSDQKIIKKSYLKLVKSLHPDVNPNGKEKFTEVQEAYEVLSDGELKKYYDQNNVWKSTGGQKEASMGGYSYSTQGKPSAGGGYTAKSSSGHQYYTHRTYTSQNPRDYYYTDNQPPKSNPKSKNYYQQQQPDSEDHPYSNRTNFNKQEKYARSKSSWEQYQRHMKQQQEKTYSHETAEQRRLRDKLKAMRGFTSSYNVMWGRHHIRPDDILETREEKLRKKEEELRQLMPEKVRKFYDKLMDTLEKVARK